MNFHGIFNKRERKLYKRLQLFVFYILNGRIKAFKQKNECRSQKALHAESYQRCQILPFQILRQKMPCGFIFRIFVFSLYDSLVRFGFTVRQEVLECIFQDGIRNRNIQNGVVFDCRIFCGNEKFRLVFIECIAEVYIIEDRPGNIAPRDVNATHVHD